MIDGHGDEKKTVITKDIGGELLAIFPRNEKLPFKTVLFRTNILAPA